jgi:hypothetical protein
MDSARICNHCGFALRPEMRFCGNCGQPVSQASNLPPVQASRKSNLLPLMLIMVGVCGLGVLIGAVLGGYLVMQYAPAAGRLTPLPASAATQSGEPAGTLPPAEASSPTAPPAARPTETLTPQPTQAEPTHTQPPATKPPPTRTQPPATRMPPLPTVAETEPTLTVGQSRTDTYISDDFSFNTFGWMEMENEQFWAGLESDAYAIHVRAAEQGIPSFLPVSFSPEEIEFDAIVPADFVDGAFGVTCNYQDEDNFDFISFATELGQYTIGQVIGGQLTSLTDPEWQSTANLDSSPPWSNHILVECSSSLIAVFINNKWEADVALTPPRQPGKMAVYAQSWGSASGGGYKVYFDNLSAWKPVQ